MPDTKILSGGLNHQPVDLVTGRIAAPTRLVANSPGAEHAQLSVGDQHLTLPEWTVFGGGPMAFQVSAGDGGATVTGMGGPGETPSFATIIEYVLLNALVILIATGGSITVAPEDSGSPEGSRFASGVVIAAGTAQAFICSSVDGVKKWFPIAFGT
jgi:hypothetical protein